MIKKIIFYFITFLFLLVNINDVYAQPNILCESAILIDSNSKTILAQKDADKKMYPASLTKIMTAILAIEMGDLTDVIIVDEKSPFEIIGSHIALEPGEILTLKDLLYSLMLPSGNDAASVLAKHFSTTDEEFAKLMNKKAKEIGALNTNFVNPHGLHNENHYTTASDLAIITSYAMKNDIFRNIVQTKRYEIKPTNKKSETRYFTNLNKMLYNNSTSQIHIDGMWLSPLYDGTNGVKTGYTPEAGNCLVSSAKRGDTELIMVALDGVSLEMYEDGHNLFNFGFNEYENTILISKNTFVQTLKIDNGDSKEISVITQDNCNIFFQKGSLNKIKSKVLLNKITLPIEKDQVIGCMEFSLDGKIIANVNLISPTTVQSTLPNWKSHSKIITFIKLTLILMVILTLFKIYNNFRAKVLRKKKRRKYRSN